jgi:hypothetical protein
MSHPDLAELFERAAAATPVSAPPLAEIAAGARSRRRRRAGLSGLVVATLTVVVIVAAALVGPAEPGAPLGAPADTVAMPDRGNLPTDLELAEYVENLQATVLPVLRELQVEYFMDESDCAILTYGRHPTHRDFADGDPGGCGGSTDDPQPFDDVVRADHARVAAALAESRTPIERVGGTFSSGELRVAVFSSTHRAPFTTTWELVYDPQTVQAHSPRGLVTIVAAVPGADGWWFQCCAD